MRRLMFAAGLFLWLTPVLAVAAGGLGLPLVPAMLSAAGAAALLATGLSRTLDARLGAAVGASRLLAVALAIAGALVVVRFATFTPFIADVSRVQSSVDAADEFRLRHSCMSSYAEAARFLDEGTHNIYHRDLYRPGNVAREIGPLRVDPYHYPPPFLLVPAAVRGVAPDFWDFRRVWFALQAVTLAGAIVGLAAWVGGRAGATALLGGLLVLTFPQAVFTFQQGNFQITAVPLAVLGFVLLTTKRHAAGAGLLAYAALAKIFPGLLVVPLLTGRHWRPVAWVTGMGAALLALTLATQGTQPIRDFVSTSLPEISSGAAFPQTESPQHSRVNWSAYGQTVRLRHLGVPWLTQPRGLMLNQVYGLAVLALAAWAGWKRSYDPTRTDDRVALLLLALGLVGLASFRSPFVGGVYGCISTLWVMAVLAARASSPRVAGTWIGALCGLAGAIWVVPSPAHPPDLAWVWISGGLVSICMAVSVWAVVSAVGAASAAPVPQEVVTAPAL